MNILPKIIGTGSFLPKKVLSNKDLGKIVDTTDEWIKTRTGMSERRIASNTETASSLGYEAARIAIENAGVDPLEIDLILVATGSPDMLFPSTACLIQNSLGAEKAVGFDLSAACSGFIYGLSVSEQYIKTGKYKTILLVSTDVISKYIDWEDRSTCVLFGDGASAVVIQGNSEGTGGILSTEIFSDGSMAEFLYVKGGGSSSPPTHESIESKENLLKMAGGSLFKVAVRKMAEASENILAQNGLTASDIHLFIPHQANMRIIKAVGSALNLSTEKIFINIEKYGNTVAVTIPLALDEAVRQGKVHKGDRILMVAFGGGLTWGAAIVEW
ncbi:MAG: beta-ketoacyl-ACP synthase III [Nitrospinota bacterium]